MNHLSLTRVAGKTLLFLAVLAAVFILSLPLSLNVFADTGSNYGGGYNNSWWGNNSNNNYNHDRNDDHDKKMSHSMGGVALAQLCIAKASHQELKVFCETILKEHNDKMSAYQSQYGGNRSYSMDSNMQNEINRLSGMNGNDFDLAIIVVLINFCNQSGDDHSKYASLYDWQHSWKDQHQSNNWWNNQNNWWGNNNWNSNDNNHDWNKDDRSHDDKNKVHDDDRDWNKDSDKKWDDHSWDNDRNKEDKRDNGDKDWDKKDDHRNNNSAHDDKDNRWWGNGFGIFNLGLGINL